MSGNLSADFWPFAAEQVSGKHYFLHLSVKLLCFTKKCFYNFDMNGYSTWGKECQSSLCSLQTLSWGSHPVVLIHKVVILWTRSPSYWSTGNADTPWTCLNIEAAQLSSRRYTVKHKLTNKKHTPWIIARARMPPVLVPATQSKSSLMGRPASFSRAMSIWISTRPFIPPPSRHRSLSILEKKHHTLGHILHLWDLNDFIFIALDCNAHLK